MAAALTAALPLADLVQALVQGFATSFPVELVPRIADILGTQTTLLPSLKQLLLYETVAVMSETADLTYVNEIAVAVKETAGSTLQHAGGTVGCHVACHDGLCIHRPFGVSASSRTPKSNGSNTQRARL